jgi:hypothetical protein
MLLLLEDASLAKGREEEKKLWGRIRTQKYLIIFDGKKILKKL